MRGGIQGDFTKLFIDCQVRVRIGYVYLAEKCGSLHTVENGFHSGYRMFVNNHSWVYCGLIVASNSDITIFLSHNEGQRSPLGKFHLFVKP